jgi:hypothetical protein
VLSGEEVAERVLRTAESVKIKSEFREGLKEAMVVA